VAGRLYDVAGEADGIGWVYSAHIKAPSLLSWQRSMPPSAAPKRRPQAPPPSASETDMRDFLFHLSPTQSKSPVVHPGTSDPAWHPHPARPRQRCFCHPARSRAGRHIMPFSGETALPVFGRRKFHGLLRRGFFHRVMALFASKTRRDSVLSTH